MTHSSPFDLQAAAQQTMLDRNFQPDFSPEVAAQLAEIHAHPPDINHAGGAGGGAVHDMRKALWSSIDNDTSRDLDQIELADRLDAGHIRVSIGIADVDAYVPKGSAIDQHAAAATTSVYAGVRIFPMLPEELSTATTSLLEGGDKLAVVIEFVVDENGVVASSQVYRALVRNYAQLTYNGVGAWLEGGQAPPKVAASVDLQAQLHLQDEAAQLLRTERYRHGALNIETIETQPVITDGQITGMALVHKNRASELIEDFMVAANGVIARLLADRNYSSIRRVVRIPERWDRIVELAKQKGATLPGEADSATLNQFLIKQKAEDPAHFPDLSLAVIKLMGPGEYVMERAGDTAVGHFGLAVQDYTHSTAPNRRFADLVSQRLVKAALAGQPSPYGDAELQEIAERCTQQENNARKVERLMTKRMAAISLSNKIGQSFDSIVTGVTSQGTWVRIVHPPVEGRLMRGAKDLDVGDRVTVTLQHTDPRQGFIDFVR